MKIGSYKYLLQLLHRLIREVHELRKTQRYMIQGLEHEFLFDTEYIRDISCKDEVDQAIVDVLRRYPRILVATANNIDTGITLAISSKNATRGAAGSGSGSWANATETAEVTTATTKAKTNSKA